MTAPDATVDGMPEPAPRLDMDEDEGLYLSSAPPGRYTRAQAAREIEHLAEAQLDMRIVVRDDEPKLVWRRNPEGDEDEETMPVVDASDPRAIPFWESYNYDTLSEPREPAGPRVVGAAHDMPPPPVVHPDQTTIAYDTGRAA